MKPPDSDLFGEASTTTEPTIVLKNLISQDHAKFNVTHGSSSNENENLTDHRNGSNSFLSITNAGKWIIGNGKSYSVNLQALNFNVKWNFQPSAGLDIDGQFRNIALSGFYTLVNLVAFAILFQATIMVWFQHSILQSHKWRLNSIEFQKNIFLLKLWFGIRLAVFLFKCILYPIYIYLGLTVCLWDHLPHIIFMGIHLYGLWVVFVFIKEIREGEGECSDSTDGEQYAPPVRNKL